MSITLANAKIFVASIIGGQDDPNLIVAAGNAIEAAFGKWNRRDDGWTFALKDTSIGFSLPSATIAVDGVTVTSTSPNIAGVNPGIGVTGVGIPASTTVSSVTRSNPTGAVTSFVLSASSTPGTVTMTVAGNIPIIAGVKEYNMPYDFDKPYSARLLSNKRVLTYIKYREVGRKVADLDNQGTPTHYTTYNPSGFDATSQHKNMLVFRTPNANDTMQVFYYRNLDPAADPLDVPQDFVYPLLHWAQFELVRSKNGDDSRLSALAQIAQSELEEAMDNDSFESEDEDLRMLSQMEMGLRTNVNLDIWDEIM